MSTTTMLDLTDQYCLANDLMQTSQERLYISARKFLRYNKRVVVGELTSTVVNRWLTELLDSGISRRTVRGHRTNLMSLWNFAYRERLCRNPPIGVRTVKVPAKPPEAWTPEEVQRLIEAAKAVPGWFSRTGIRRATFWEAFVRFAYGSALRLGDTLRMERRWIADDGTFVIVQHKTGQEHRAKVLPKTLEAIDRCMAEQPGRELIWPVWYDDRPSREPFYVAFRRLAKAASLKGSSKWLRRSSATEVERIRPGSAMAHLGHKTPGLAYRNYVDPRLLQFDRIVPPELD